MRVLYVYTKTVRKLPTGLAVIGPELVTVVKRYWKCSCEGQEKSYGFLQKELKLLAEQIQLRLSLQGGMLGCCSVVSPVIIYCCCHIVLQATVNFTQSPICRQQNNSGEVGDPDADLEVLTRQYEAEAEAAKAEALGEARTMALQSRGMAERRSNALATPLSSDTK